MDMNVQGIALQFVTKAVDAVFELLGRQHASAVMQQSLQQCLLTSRQVDRLTAQQGNAAAGVVAQLPVFDQIDAAPGHPAQQGVQAGGQFTQVKGLEQVVIGPGLQAIHPVGDRVTGGQHQHGQFKALLTQLLQQLEAVFVRQPQVEHHHIKLGGLEHGFGFAGGTDMFNRQPLRRQPGHNAAGNQFIVFANQYVHAHTRVNRLIKKLWD